MSLLDLLATIWAISAAFALEIQEDCLLGGRDRWLAILIGSLMPVYNTLLVLSYLRHLYFERERN